MNWLAVTPGEPAGIGPECLLKLHQARPELPIIAVADPSLLRQAAEQMGLQVAIEHWSQEATPGAAKLYCHAVPMPVASKPGVLDPCNAPYVLETLRQSLALIKSGYAAALVTGPVHKGNICDSGFAFSGHTEFLADQAGIPKVVMMLAAGPLRVALVTTHMPLSQVPAAITHDNVTQTIDITLRALQNQWGIEKPRLQVLGLNPHAGEDGHLGHEDDSIILPAIEQFRAAGHTVLGPVPADTAFTPTALDTCDAVVAMYHDQGLPVLKHAGFGRAVNVTLGLPFIRTSVDHGTAVDIAGKGLADAASFGHAADQAMQMVQQAEPVTH